MLKLYDTYKIKKPIRLIELFAGYGSQALALENLGVDFEHHQVIEFDRYAMQSYNALHGTNFKPQDITKISDLNITRKDKYDYIMTYSFPCQDLSLAGKRAGMGKGTRSGLLWEVERLLLNNDLPQVLIMENVTQVHGTKNKEDFRKWTEFLAKLGYSNQWKELNAKDYGIPQNRNRTFMISILGDYEYHFPEPFELNLRLKDMLEENVDEKYYLSEKMIKGMKNTKFNTYSYENKVQDKNEISSTILSRFENASHCIEIPEDTKKGYKEAYEGDGVYINRPHQKRGTVQKGMIQTIKTSSDDIGVVIGNDEKDNTNNLRIRKLTPRECFRLMGLKDYQIDKIQKTGLSNSQQYKQAGNSIVVNVLAAIFKQLLKRVE